MVQNIIIIATEKVWNIPLVKNIEKKYSNLKVIHVTTKDELTLQVSKNENIKYIFFPHWSYIIPKSIYEKYECVVFHMTDLPYGRGGSPLQNLIVRGYSETKISALKVNEGVDTGDIYLKKDLLLLGNAKQIFENASLIIEEMILEILDNNIIPKPQQGISVVFKRRKKEDGDVIGLATILEVYNYIRMLDAPGYPNAFLKTPKGVKYEFFDAIFDGNDLYAKVKITNELEK